MQLVGAARETLEQGKGRGSDQEAPTIPARTMRIVFHIEFESTENEGG
jgi:hypothetical protein